MTYKVGLRHGEEHIFKAFSFRYDSSSGFLWFFDDKASFANDTGMTRVYPKGEWRWVIKVDDEEPAPPHTSGPYR